jgi:EAL domain-containing protein (putative c-di-GMP-specific phosphodiesterase class I)/CheY-like chemotaxis protein
MTTAAAKGRVLMADDEPDLLDAYSSLLTESGFEVTTAGNGRQALERLSEHEFDVLLSDIVMPDMDGLQLLRAVRERDLDLPVLLMTGSPKLETAVQALEYGALKYLLKPVREEPLVRAVEEAVRLSRVARLKRELLDHLGGEDRQVGDRASLEVGFSRALGSLWMAYQPIVRAADASIYGYEALVRTAERTLPHPGALFDAAERLGRVQALGRAIREAVAASVAGPIARGVVFMNLHAQELQDATLYSPDAALSRHARSVVLEITERASLEQVPDVRVRIRSLRDLGYRIAIDDLGAGYAGLTSFAALEPEVVKLDMALVRGVDAQPIKRRLIGSMVQLCKELGILVVAEGVETEAERDVLKELGSDLLQGYLFGRPEAPGKP